MHDQIGSARFKKVRTGSTCAGSNRTGGSPRKPSKKNPPPKRFGAGSSLLDPQARDEHNVKHIIRTLAENDFRLTPKLPEVERKPPTGQ